MVHVRPIPPGGLANGVLVIAALPLKADADLAFLGPVLADEVAKAIAEGMILQAVHKLTQRLQTWQPFLTGMRQSFWSCDGLQDWAVQGVLDVGLIPPYPIKFATMMSR